MYRFKSIIRKWTFTTNRLTTKKWSVGLLDFENKRNKKNDVIKPNISLTEKLTLHIIKTCKKGGDTSRMSGSEIRRTMPLFPIGIVMQLTDLTARQIRYYEEHQLISPARTEGNRRMFSLNDIDLLLEIKDLIDQGVNLAGIKQLFSAKEKEEVTEEMEKEAKKVRRELSDDELRKILRSEIMQAGRFNRSSFRQGDRSRFFKS